MECKLLETIDVFTAKLVNRPTEQSKRIQASAAGCDISLAVTNPTL